MGGIEERWEGPSKTAEFLGLTEEWHHAWVTGKRGKSTSLAEPRCPKD